MVRHRCARGSEIEAVVGNPEVEIEMAREKESVRVGERIVDGILVAETSAPVQIAFEDVARLQFKDVQRNGFRFLFGHRPQLLAGAGPAGGGKKEDGEEK